MVTYASPPDEEKPRKTYTEMLEAIEKAAEDRDPEVLSAIAEAINDQWGDHEGPTYGNLVRAFVREVAAGGALGNDKISELTREFADQALEEHRGKISIRSLISIVGGARTDMHAVDAGKRDIFRLRDARRSLLLIREHHSRIDPDFDRDTYKHYIAWPPPGVKRWANGMSPEAIEDPELREIYKKRLEKQWESTEYYNEQVGLRSVSDRIIKQVKRHLSSIYSIHGGDICELRKLLDKYVQDEEVKKEILEAVQSKMGTLGVKDARDACGLLRTRGVNG